MNKNLITSVLIFIFCFSFVNVHYAETKKEEAFKRARIDQMNNELKELYLRQQSESLSDVEKAKIREHMKQLELKLAQMQYEEGLKKNLPEVYQNLLKLKEKDPLEHQRLAIQIYQQALKMQQQKSENPELAEVNLKTYEIEVKLALLQKEYRSLKDAEKHKKVKQEMHELLTKLFDLKVKKRKMEIKNLQQEIGTLEAELSKIVKNKEESIRMKLQQMTEGDVFSW